MVTTKSPFWALITSLQMQVQLHLCTNAATMGAGRGQAGDSAERTLLSGWGRV